MNDGTFSIFTGCSGTDGLFKYLESMTKHWESSYNIRLRIEHTGSVEIEPNKKKFIIGQHKVSFLANDVNDLGDRELANLITGKMQSVPRSKCFAGGFSCRSRSPLNIHAAEFLGCIQNKSKKASTAITYDALSQHAFRHGYDLIILENLKSLDQKGDQLAMTDSQYILQDRACAHVGVRRRRYLCGSASQRRVEAITPLFVVVLHR